MNHGALADIVVVIHFLWIVFLIAGAIPGVRYRAVKFIHIGALAFAMIIQVLGWYCPLTHLEQWLRTLHDPAQSYSGSFIGHYLEKVVYLEVSRHIIFTVTIILIAVNVCIYWIGRKEDVPVKRETRK